MTSVQTPYPPDGPIGRRRFWDDAVFEAIGELRRGLSSGRESLYMTALLTIVELEKHKMRHGRPISGTTVPNVTEDDDRSDPLPKLAPLDEDRPNRRAVAPPAETPVPHPTTTDVPKNQVSIPAAPVITDRAAEATPPPTPTRVHIPGVTCHFSDRDDDWTRDPDRGPITDWEPDPWVVAEQRRTERMRESYIEVTGRYPEDDFPDNPDYHRFKAEPRPHKAFLRWLCWKYGTGDDTLPLGTEPETGTVPAVPLGVWPPAGDGTG